MNLKSVLRWTAMYRAVTWAAGLVFLLFLGGAAFLGLGDVVATAIWGNPYALLADPAGTLPPLLLALVGFLFWQVVTTAAFYKTVTEATEEQMAERFDSEKVKSEVLSVLDDRLSEMQTQVERTRREVEELDTDGGPTTGLTTGSAGGTGGTDGAGGAGGAGNAGDTGSFDFES